jgi:hypothetical protein
VAGVLPQDNSGALFAPEFKNIPGQTSSEKFGGIQKWKKLSRF